MVTLLLEAPAKNGEAIVSTWSLLKCTVLGLLHRRIVESEINININRMITAISMHFSNEAFASSLSSREMSLLATTPNLVQQCRYIEYAFEAVTIIFMTRKAWEKWQATIKEIHLFGSLFPSPSLSSCTRH